MRAVLVRVHVRADLRAAQPQLAHASFQLTRRQIGILQRDRRQAREPSRIIANHLRDVIVQPARKIERVCGLCPITEHHRHGREHLHRNFLAIAVFDAVLRIPNIIGDLAKNAFADHHPRATRLVMIEPNEPAVAVFLVEVRPLARKDVGVQIDLQGKWRVMSDK